MSMYAIRWLFHCLRRESVMDAQFNLCFINMRIGKYDRRLFDCRSFGGILVFIQLQWFIQYLCGSRVGIKGIMYQLSLCHQRCKILF